MEDDSTSTVAAAGSPDIRRVPGALEALIACRPHATICVATNAMVSNDAEVWDALSLAGLAGGVSHVFSRQSLGFGKQDERFWLHVQATLGLMPQHMLMIGDDFDGDVAAPARAGLNALWLNRETQERRVGTGYDTLFSLTELPDRLFG